MRTIQISDEQCKLLCEILKNQVAINEKFIKKQRRPKMRELAETAVREYNNLLEILNKN